MLSVHPCHTRYSLAVGKEVGHDRKVEALGLIHVEDGEALLLLHLENECSRFEVEVDWLRDPKEFALRQLVEKCAEGRQRSPSSLANSWCPMSSSI